MATKNGRPLRTTAKWYSTPNKDGTHRLTIEYPTLLNRRTRITIANNCQHKIDTASPCSHLIETIQKIAELNNDIYSDLPEKIRVLDFIDKYLNFAIKSSISKNSKKLKIVVLNRFRQFCINNNIKLLNQIDRKIVDYYILELQNSKMKNGNHLRDTSIVKYWAIMQTAFQKAKNWNYVNINVFGYADTGTKKYIKNVSIMEQNWLTDDDITVIKDNLDGQWLDIFLFALNTGLRISEISYLTFQQCRANMIFVESRPNYKPKSKNRSVYTNPVVAEIIDRRLKIAKSYYKVINGDVSQLYVFHALKRGRLWEETIRLYFNKLFLKLNIKGNNNTKLVFHSIRHSFASRLIRVANPAVVMTILGHSDIGMTEQYLHGFAQDKIDAITAVQIGL